MSLTLVFILDLVLLQVLRKQTAMILLVIMANVLLPPGSVINMMIVEMVRMSAVVVCVCFRAFTLEGGQN